MKDISKRMKRTENVARNLRERKRYRVLVWRSKHLGRSQLRWERNIKICLKVWKGLEVIRLVEDRWK